MRFVFPLLLAVALSGCGTAQGSLFTDGSALFESSETAKDRELYLDLIDGLKQRGLHRAALAHLDEFERKYSPTARSELLRAECLAAVQQYDAATEAFRTQLSGPNAAAAHHGLGLIAAKTDHWADAVTQFSEAVRLEPTNPRFLNNLGFALLRSGDIATAEFRLRQAQELDGNSAEIRNNLALLLAATGRQAEAEPLLAKAGAPGEREALLRQAALLRTPEEKRP